VFQGSWQQIALMVLMGLGVLFVVVGQFFDAPGADDTIMLMILLTVGMVILAVIMMVQGLRPRSVEPEPVNPISDEMVGAMFLAREEAEQGGQPTITDLHLLRGLLRTRGSTAELALTRAGITLDQLAEPLPQPAGTYVETGSHQVPLSVTAQLCLRVAHEEALVLGHPQMRTEHVLLALLRDDVSSVANIIEEAGLDRGGVLALLVVSGL